MLIINRSIGGVSPSSISIIFKTRMDKKMKLTYFKHLLRIRCQIVTIYKAKFYSIEGVVNCKKHEERTFEDRHCHQCALVHS